MRALITVVVLSLICQLAVGQKNFEGKIIYKFFQSDEKNEGTFETYFGKEKIKVLIKANNSKSEKDDLLIDFNAGILYYINSNNKTYRKENLGDSLKITYRMSSLQITPKKNKTILGYHCTAYSGKDTIKSGFSEPMSFTIWYADSLLFGFNKKYLIGNMIPVFGNGSKIGLAFELMLGNDKKRNKMEASLFSIEPSSSPDSFFIIPQDYVAEKMWGQGFDSTKAEADSIQSVEHRQLSDEEMKEIMEKAAAAVKEAVDKATTQSVMKKKKAASKNTHNQPTKSAAIKPKQ
jgi:hypothetical protein